MPLSDNSIITAGLKALEIRLPDRWRLRERKQRQRGMQPDALVELRSPDGAAAVILIEAKRRVPAQITDDLARRLASAASVAKADTTLLFAPFLSLTTRDRLARAGINYLDLTGNARIILNRPSVFIDSLGAETDPNPPERGIKSLKGAKAARLVRALCDWRPPVGVRELASRAGTDPGYASRILKLLEDEATIQRGTNGAVMVVNWRELLRRWTSDYGVTETNRAVPFLAPRGLDSLAGSLARLKNRWALTGVMAVPAAARLTPSRLATCYVDRPEKAAEQLDLRPAEAGANVLLLEPFDEVVYARSRRQDGLSCVALSQCLADLLTGSGREPSEAESLVNWMEKNEDAWRS